MDKNKELFKKVEARLHNYKYLQIQIDNLELDIEEIKNDYRGCGSISYDERTGSTYNISRTIENEIIDNLNMKHIANKEYVKLREQRISIANSLCSHNVIDYSFISKKKLIKKKM